MNEKICITKEYMSNNHVSETLMEKWCDWQWQVRNTIRKVETVEMILGITFSDSQKFDIERTLSQFPMAISPYYLSLVDIHNYDNDPIFKQCFPSVLELNISPCDMSDPLHEEADSPAPCITHRYPDRVLFHVSNVCGMYCRHCTRKRKVGDLDSIPSKEALLKGIEYIKNTPVIRDVLLSGGDPFLLSDTMIDWLLKEITAIDHVEVVRIGTRTPVVLPFRITDELVSILKKYDNIWINTHFNHSREMTTEASIALKKLRLAGIPLGNQSVLLKGVNDCTYIMKDLLHKLVLNGVRPYYLYQCDLSEGLEHFRTNIGTGIEIVENLRGHTSGFAIPTYVIDAPGGGGKIPVMPNYLVSWSSNKVVLRNYEGVITTYQMPINDNTSSCDLNCEACHLQRNHDTSCREYQSIGIAKLLSDYEEDYTLIPEKLLRHSRRE